MKKNIILILIMLVLTAFKGDDRLVFVKTLNINTDFITTDNLSNLYCVKNFTIEKYDSKGNLLKTYSNKLHGKISFIDATNPFKILVFYSGFQRIVFLDNMLADQGDPVNISELELPVTTLVCSSYNNGFWIYNQQNMELVRFDESFQLTHKTGNISINTGYAISPNYLIEYNNKVYLNDPKRGIIIFDVFGTYSKTINLQGVAKFQAKENELYFVEKDSILMKYNIKFMETTELPINDSSRAIRIEKDKLYIQHPHTIGLYIIK